jgi:hypothetical protein
MEVADIRRLLNESKSSGKPIGCAVGMSKDMKTALLLLHKTHEGSELGRNLKKDVPDVVNMRFGTARIDEENQKMVRLVLNRPVSGVAKKLIKTLKGTGYTKVKLGLEDGTEFEGADDEEDAQAQAAKQAQAPTAEAARPAPPPPATEAPAIPAAGAAPPPPPAPEKDAAPPDADALKKELAALAGQIPGAAGGDAAKTAAMVKLAREGQANIATNNLKYAATSIEQLRRAIAAAGAGAEKPAAAAAPPPPPPPPAAQAAKPDVDALRKQLEALAKRIPEAAAGDAKRSAELVKLAREAQVNITTNNLTYATTSIEQLRNAIEGKAAAPAAPPPDAQQSFNFLQRLKLLILKAANGDAALQAQWMAMANAAEAKLSGGDAAGGSAGVEALRVAMLPAVTRMQDEAKATGAYTSSGKKWLEMRQTVEDEMEKLRLTIAGAYQDDPALPAIENAFRATTAPVLRTLDASLATKLEAASKAAKPEERQKLVDEAHSIIEGYKKYAADPLLADLDNNPFVPLSLQASLTATLSELAGAIH